MSKDPKSCLDYTQFPTSFPPQHQSYQPGNEFEMNPLPIFDDPCYLGCNRLKGKVALITGGDSGIGRAVAVAFAKEGAKLAISYLCEEEDANQTKAIIESYGGECLLLPGDIRSKDFCQSLAKSTYDHYGALDVLINNAAVQFPQDDFQNISEEQLKTTFEINVFPIFYLTQAALCYMKSGSSIINTTSITAYEGHDQLIDYSSTKGAIVSFTRSLSQSLVSKGIRVNAVAPGPIWTPLIVSSFSKDEVAKFGQSSPMKRAGQPVELAPSYVYLASNDASYVTGQVLHVNGGTIVDS
ncbi:MAG: SDR family oxidoreductase [Cellulosilyticum sp.]|nr:SDR family oxidoreductase [Cellulosilyticum sp.]